MNKERLKNIVNEAVAWVNQPETDPIITNCLTAQKIWLEISSTNLSIREATALANDGRHTLVDLRAKNIESMYILSDNTDFIRLLAERLAWESNNMNNILDKNENSLIWFGVRQAMTVTNDLQTTTEPEIISHNIYMVDRTGHTAEIVNLQAENTDFAAAEDWMADTNQEISNIVLYTLLHEAP